ncbi:MAG: hypothetical protein A2Y79_10935 [Deltaproteobacteria bacterium RBG_13_43_22]|nr:MAG: hypothetical protein A2Y79_10935 [Deltaproteobacteria bacterium RBG_13_43_22]
MKNQKKNKGYKERTVKIRLIVYIGLFFFFFGMGATYGDDWTPLPWGLNLEELNQAFKEKNKAGRIQEDKDRPEIELQYALTKSLKVRIGKLKALLSSTDPSKPGRLYGYAFEGKFFGRVIFFKDHPEYFPETVPRTLKEKYPQGKIIRSFSTDRSLSSFEYKTDHLYVFSTGNGVFFYEPNILEKAIRMGQGQINLEEQRSQKELWEKTSDRH